MSEDSANGVLYDGTRCIGCRACSVACKVWNENPADLEAKVTTDGGIPGKGTVSSKTFTYMRFREVEDDSGLKWAFTKIQCMHCLNPACEAACIVGALRRSESTGAVVYDKGKCIGCRYCMVACPFGIPCYQWGDPSPWIKKCTFCASRQKARENPEPEELMKEENLEPACVTTCPTDALKFGKREDLLEEAKKRIADSPGRYYDHIYGENEVGGTSWMYISSVSPDNLDMPKVSDEPVPKNARKTMGTLPYYAVGVIGLMAAIYWVTKRRDKVAAGAHEKKEG